MAFTLNDNVEGHCKTTYIFVNTTKNVALSLATKFSSKVQVFLIKFEPKFEHCCRHLEQYLAARPCFRHVFNYHSGLWLFLNDIILSQKCSKLWNSIEDRGVKIRLENIDLLTLWRMPSQLQVFSSLPPVSSDWMTSRNYGLAAKTVSKWRPPRSISSE